MQAKQQVSAHSRILRAQIGCNNNTGYNNDDTY